MIFSNLKNSFVSAAAFLVLVGAATTALADPVKNIVLVHGAWVDGSGWKPVYEILNKDGYDVTMVQEPLTSLQDDQYTFRENTRQIIGQCSRTTYSMGQRIRVLVDRIDPLEKKIQFAVLEEAPARRTPQTPSRKSKRKR